MGNFRVPAPDLGPGTAFRKDKDKSGGGIWFESNFGLVRAVAFFRLEPPPPEDFTGPGRDAMLRKALDIFSASYGAETMANENLTLVPGTSALFGLLSVPKSAPMVNLKTGEHQDSFWSVAIFLREDFLYTLVVGVADWPNAPVPTPRRVEVGKETLQEFFKALEFK